MAHYYISWEYAVEADNPRDAAEKSAERQSRDLAPNGIPGVFKVRLMDPLKERDNYVGDAHEIQERILRKPYELVDLAE